MDSIERKTLLYKTGVEYGDYTINHVFGCSHGCKFPCYAFMMKKRFGDIKSYDEWIKPKIVSNALEILDKEIPKMKKDIKSVHLCFTTDPFMIGYPEVSNVSIQIMKKLNDNNIKCTCLTKGVLPFELSNLSKTNEYGITIISLNENFRKEYEPNSAKYEDRINSLKKLHEVGCYTWVSIEPYPTPNIVKQSLKDILDKISFVDKIIFGRWNYNKVVSQYKNAKEYFNDMSEIVINFCKENNIAYHIKDGTITKK